MHRKADSSHACSASYLLKTYQNENEMENTDQTTLFFLSVLSPDGRFLLPKTVYVFADTEIIIKLEKKRSNTTF